LTEVAALKLAGNKRAIAFPHRPRCDSEALLRSADRIQQLQQQIEAWQALLEKLGGNE
jgi:hypothetical protein